jgi:hypothetical protein
MVVFTAIRFQSRTASAFATAGPNSRVAINMNRPKVLFVASPWIIFIVLPPILTAFGQCDRILQRGDDWAGSQGVSEVTVPRSPAVHPPLVMSVPVKVALVKYSLEVTPSPSTAVKAKEVSSAITVVATPIAVGRWKQSGAPTCRAQGGVIAICAPHRAHDTEGTNPNTNTHDAPEIFRTIGRPPSMLLDQINPHLVEFIDS